MGRIRQAIAGWANYCVRPTWRVPVLSNEERITDAVRLIRRWISSTFWWRWDYRHTNSLSRYPVPAPVKLLPYGAVEIWLFFFPLLLCLSGNVNRRSKDCFNTKSIVNRFKLGFSFCWVFFLAGCRSGGISFCWTFVLTGFRSTGRKPAGGPSDIRFSQGAGDSYVQAHIIIVLQTSTWSLFWWSPQSFMIIIH